MGAEKDKRRFSILNGIEMACIGDTHQSVLKEFQKLVVLKDELHAATAENIFSTKEDSVIQNILHENQEHLAFLSQTTELENQFSNICQNVSRRSCALVESQPNPQFWNRNLSKNLQSCWQKVEQFALINRIHVSNAADYHMFFYNCDHFFYTLRRNVDDILKRTDNLVDLSSTIESAILLNEILSSSKRQFNSMSSTLANLMAKARQISPINLRVKPVTKPMSGMMLCDYRVGRHTLRAGQHVCVVNNACEEEDNFNIGNPECLGNLIDEPICGDKLAKSRDSSENSDSPLPSSNSYSLLENMESRYFPLASPGRSMMWTVRVGGVERDFAVPAVTVVLTEQDPAALETTSEIYDYFNNIWTECIDNWLVKAVKIFGKVLSDICAIDIVRIDDELHLDEFLKQLSNAFPVNQEIGSFFNRQINECINRLRQKRRTKTKDKCTISSLEVITYRKILFLLKEFAQKTAFFRKNMAKRALGNYLNTHVIPQSEQIKYLMDDMDVNLARLNALKDEVNALRSKPQRSMPSLLTMETADYDRPRYCLMRPNCYEKSYSLCVGFKAQAGSCNSFKSSDCLCTSCSWDSWSSSECCPSLSDGSGELEVRHKRRSQSCDSLVRRVNANNASVEEWITVDRFQHEMTLGRRMHLSKHMSPTRWSPNSVYKSRHRIKINPMFKSQKLVSLSIQPSQDNYKPIKTTSLKSVHQVPLEFEENRSELSMIKTDNEKSIDAWIQVNTANQTIKSDCATQTTHFIPLDEVDNLPNEAAPTTTTRSAVPRLRLIAEKNGAHYSRASINSHSMPLFQQSLPSKCDGRNIFKFLKTATASATMKLSTTSTSWESKLTIFPETKNISTETEMVMLIPGVSSFNSEDFNNIVPKQPSLLQIMSPSELSLINVGTISKTSLTQTSACASQTSKLIKSDDESKLSHLDVARSELKDSKPRSCNISTMTTSELCSYTMQTALPLVHETLFSHSNEHRNEVIVELMPDNSLVVPSRSSTPGILIPRNTSPTSEHKISPNQQETRFSSIVVCMSQESDENHFTHVGANQDPLVRMTPKPPLLQNKPLDPTEKKQVPTSTSSCVPALSDTWLQAGKDSLEAITEFEINYQQSCALLTVSSTNSFVELPPHAHVSKSNVFASSTKEKSTSFNYEEFMEPVKVIYSAVTTATQAGIESSVLTLKTQTECCTARPLTVSIVQTMPIENPQIAMVYEGNIPCLTGEPDFQSNVSTPPSSDNVNSQFLKLVSVKTLQNGTQIQPEISVAPNKNLSQYEPLKEVIELAVTNTETSAYTNDCAKFENSPTMQANRHLCATAVQTSKIIFDENIHPRSFLFFKSDNLLKLAGFGTAVSTSKVYEPIIYHNPQPIMKSICIQSNVDINVHEAISCYFERTVDDPHGAEHAMVLYPKPSVNDSPISYEEEPIVQEAPTLSVKFSIDKSENKMPIVPITMNSNTLKIKQVDSLREVITGSISEINFAKELPQKIISSNMDLLPSSCYPEPCRPIIWTKTETYREHADKSFQASLMSKVNNNDSKTSVKTDMRTLEDNEDLLCEWEDIEFKEEFYIFHDLHSVETQTSALSIEAWFNYRHQNNFLDHDTLKQFVDACDFVKRSIFNRHVSEEMDELLLRMGYACVDNQMYQNLINRGNIKEVYCQTTCEDNERFFAAVNIPFIDELYTQDSIDDDLSTASASELSADERYVQRLKLGQIEESECSATPITVNVACQAFDLDSLLQLTHLHGTPDKEMIYVYDAPSQLWVTRGATDTGCQVDASQTCNTTYSIRMNEVEKIEHHVCEETHIRAKPILTQKLISNSVVTEATQFDPLLSVVEHDFGNVYLQHHHGNIDVEERSLISHDNIPDTSRPQTTFVSLRHRILEYELCSFNCHFECSNLFYIERESFGILKTEATQLLNTHTRLYISIDQAWASQLIKEVDNAILIHDIARCLWITVEEAVGLDILRVKPTPNRRSATDLYQKTVTIFEVTGIRSPTGDGRYSSWLKPLEAERNELFNCKTGELWTSRQTSSTGRWCSFLDARRAGWIRLTPGCNTTYWNALFQSNNYERYTLHDDVTLVAYADEGC